MLSRTVVERYCSLVASDSFQKFVSQWANKLHLAIVQNGQLREPQVVKDIVQKLNGLGVAGIRTYTAFIHQKPYVEFYDNSWTKPRRAELGDLIFMVSVIHNKKKGV